MRLLGKRITLARGVGGNKQNVAVHKRGPPDLPHTVHRLEIPHRPLRVVVKVAKEHRLHGHTRSSVDMQYRISSNVRRRQSTQSTPSTHLGILHPKRLASKFKEGVHRLDLIRDLQVLDLWLTGRRRQQQQQECRVIKSTKEQKEGPKKKKRAVGSKNDVKRSMLSQKIAKAFCNQPESGIRPHCLPKDLAS